MNFNFMSSNCLPDNNIVKISDKGCTQFTETDGIKKGGSKFSEKLNSLLGSHNDTPQNGQQNSIDNGSDTRFNAVISSLDTSDTHFNRLMALLSNDIKNGRGIDFINKLKAYLTISGKDTKTATINGKGLQALEALLVKAGFAEDEINDLVAELQLRSQDGKIKLSDLFDGLSELQTEKSDFKKNDKNKDDDNRLIAISAIPFIESIMTALGIPGDLSDKIISDAKKGGRGINLDTLIDGLQKLNKKAFLSNISLKTDSQNNSFNRMLAQMGLVKPGSDTMDTTDNKGENNKFTLEDFLSKLEQMRNENKADVVDTLKTGQNYSGKTDNLLGVLMTSLNGESLDNLNNSRKINNKSEQGLSGKFLNKGFSKEINSIFPLQSDKQIPGSQPVSGDGSAESEFDKLMDKVASLVTTDKNNYNSHDGAKGNTNIISETQDKKTSVKAMDSSNLSEGAFKEFDTDGKSIGSLKARSSARSSSLLPSHVTNQVARGLVRAIYRGDSELRLQLKPPELGRLVIKINNLGDSMKLSILTDNHVAKNLLTFHESSLKAVLASSGISIDSFDVSMGSNLGQSMNSAGNNTGFNSGSGNKRRSSLPEDISEVIINQGINADNFLNSDGALHLVA